MDKISPQDGWGEEAIEIGLWHANAEATRIDISQVILIGDAPANSENDIKLKRTSVDSGFGEQYWATTKFKNPTYYVNEMDKLKQKNIPIHAFYVGLRAKKNFHEIANATGGKCEWLDINSQSGAQRLTDLVTEQVLRGVGGKNGKGDDLVEAYRTKYPKSYQ